MKLEWKNCFKIGASIFILYLCIHYLENVQGFISAVIGAAAPLIAGVIIAYPVNILMTFYEKRFFTKTKKPNLIKFRRPVCMAGAFLTLIAIIVLIISLVLPQLMSCVQLIISELPDAIRFLISRIEALGIVPEDMLDFAAEIDWKSRIGSILDAFTSGMGNVMDIVFTTVTSVFSGIISTLLSIIFSIYLLASKDRLKSQFTRLLKHYLKDKICAKISYIVSVLNHSFHSYIVGQCTEAVILGLLCTIGMFILRLPYAAMIGALVAFTALIPVAGAYIGAGVGVFMIFTVSPIQALIFLIFIIILQQIEGNLIYPKVVGSSIGLPGIWVLAAVTVGGGIFGVLGMLFAVPLASALYRLISEDVNKII